MKAKVIVAVAALVLAGWSAGTARGDFTLWNDELLTVNTSHSLGTLFDRSRASLISGAWVGNLYSYNFSTVGICGGSAVGMSNLYAYDSSTVNISWGQVNHNLYCYDTSAVNMSAGPAGALPSVTYLFANNSSAVNISAGSVYQCAANDSSHVTISGGRVGNQLYASDTSTVDVSGGTVSGVLYATGTSVVTVSGGQVDSLGVIDTGTVSITGGQVTGLSASHSGAVKLSGGSLAWLEASSTSTVTFNAREFRLGRGLTLDGDRVLGTGILNGEWFNGTRWTVDIARNDFGTTILAIPEPATLSLLALLALSLPKRGGLAMMRRGRRAR